MEVQSSSSTYSSRKSWVEVWVSVDLGQWCRLDTGFCDRLQHCWSSRRRSGIRRRGRANTLVDVTRSRLLVERAATGKHPGGCSHWDGELWRRWQPCIDRNRNRGRVGDYAMVRITAACLPCWLVGAGNACRLWYKLHGFSTRGICGWGGRRRHYGSNTCLASEYV